MAALSGPGDTYMLKLAFAFLEFIVRGPSKFSIELCCLVRMGASSLDLPSWLEEGPCSCCRSVLSLVTIY